VYDVERGASNVRSFSGANDHADSRGVDGDLRSPGYRSKSVVVLHVVAVAAGR
jgi:hypothetical protein